MRDISIWTIVALIIIGATIGLFITLAPESTGYSYWVVMVDVALVELIVGAYVMYYRLADSAKHKNGSTISISISMFSTFAIVSLLGIFVDILLIALQVADLVILWLIIGRWALLLAIVTPMWFTAQTRIASQKKLELSRKRRTSVSSMLEQVLANLRSLTIDATNHALLNKVIDETETIRNKIHSRASDPALGDSKEDKMEKLVTELASITKNPSSTPEETIKQAGIMIREIANLF